MSRYNQAMMNEEQFLEYLDLCEAIADRMQRDGLWPWQDSTNPDDLVDSPHNPNTL